MHHFSDHPWIREDGDAPDTPLDNAVLNRLKQFSAMHKFKKAALRVRISPSFFFFFSLKNANGRCLPCYTGSLTELPLPSAGRLVQP